MATKSNLSRVLRSGLSVDGWHTSLDADGHAQVHVDISFETGKFGGEPTDKVQFELDFKRVQVIVYCGERVSPIKSSIERNLPADPQLSQGEQNLRSSVDAVLKVDVGINPPKLNAKLNLGAARAKEQDIRSLPGSTIPLLTRYINHLGSHPSWEIRSLEDKALKGAPWHPVREPRFTFKYSPTKSEPSPHIKIVIQCRKEDLIIKNPEVLEPASRTLLPGKRRSDASRIAAEQLLKNIIHEEGLPLPRLDKDFEEISVADVVITSE